MSSNAFRHVISGLLSFAFIGSHLTRSKARLFPQRSPPRLLTAAACGRFVASPCRATTEGLPPSREQPGIKKAPVISYGSPFYRAVHTWPEPPFRTSSCLHGAPSSYTLSAPWPVSELL